MVAQMSIDHAAGRIGPHAHGALDVRIGLQALEWANLVGLHGQLGEKLRQDGIGSSHAGLHVIRVARIGDLGLVRLVFGQGHAAVGLR